MFQKKLMKFGILFLGFFVSCYFPLSAVESSMKYFWLKDKNTIEILSLDKLNTAKLSLRDSKGKKLVFSVKKQTARKLELTLNFDLTSSPWYKAVYEGKELTSTPHYTYLNNYFHYTGPLGVSKRENSYLFHMWSPTAHRVELVVYENYTNQVLKKVDMISAERGLFFIQLEEEYKGKSYQYHVHSGNKVTKPLILMPK